MRTKEQDKAHLDLHNELMHVVVRLPSDYKPYGEVERWKDDNKNYPDCSMGCKHYKTLSGELSADWGVCANRQSRRFGFLTFEHQAGLDCYER